MMRRPVSAVGYRRPLSQHARTAMMLRPDPRYRADNILQLQQDLPSRSTREYQGPAMAANMAAVLEGALRDEDDIEVDASGLHTAGPAPSPTPTPSVPAPSVSSSRIPKPSRPRTGKMSGGPTASQSPSGSAAPLYPQCRGLVPK
ncbi:hypothetical protein JZ751_024200 [Albula glossodonta]|uniref:Uncharacterized protein n=1 Tax=Albula glossodonta TaxID=121402 RepID=A0A8T2N1P6_9TELE|nr:hypothetical protein JZ751_024200 [Albula glossodonta]